MHVFVCVWEKESSLLRLLSDTWIFRFPSAVWETGPLWMQCQALCWLFLNIPLYNYEWKNLYHLDSVFNLIFLFPHFVFKNDCVIHFCIGSFVMEKDAYPSIPCVHILWLISRQRNPAKSSSSGCLSFRAILMIFFHAIAISIMGI